LFSRRILELLFHACCCNGEQRLRNEAILAMIEERRKDLVISANKQSFQHGEHPMR